ncbi:MAG: ral secretion pathway protein GspF, partial [Gammaproteobacteria bacterium]|nr:ral secretion pathway protein GspF [Gammaproteobacteria bacterium]
RYNNPAAVNPDVDTHIVGAGGIFTTAEYQSNSDYQKTAAVMKLVIDGNAAAGTIEMGGFDYHSGNRADGEARDLNVGNCIGACLEYAARVGKPVMIYVFSDGSLASSGMIDSSVGGRGKGVWTADNQNVAATYFLVYNPGGKPQPAQTNPEMSLQLGYFNSDGSLSTTGSPAGNNVFNLVQMVVLNYMALHGAQGAFPTLYAAPNLNNTLGTTAAALDALISFQPLAGLVNGKIAG